MKKITLPLTDEDISLLKAGDSVLLSGTILTGRDCAHKRICEFLDRGENRPSILKGKPSIMRAPAPHPKARPAAAAAPPRARAWTPLRRGCSISD